ncbi:MAG: hypothetical protein C0483_23165 [Pirellula sp.]|nr:hypothetical protein [Pirellula sp.]
MVNVSSFYVHTIELGVEEFRAVVRSGRIYGEMNYVTYQASGVPKGQGRRYTTFEVYRASALNLLHRGADGLSLFNYDYIPADKRPAMAEGLKQITDLEFLRQASKNYVIYPGFGTFPAKNECNLELVIPDDVSQVRFDRAVIRVETKADCAALNIAVSLNGQSLETQAHEGTELFTPVAENVGYPQARTLKFFKVPLGRLIAGTNSLKIKNLDSSKQSCELQSMELALYR